MILSTRFKIALAKMFAAPIRLTRRMLGASDDVVEVTRRGLRWRLDLNEGIDFSIYLLGEFEPATVRGYEQLIRSDGIVLDIGANIGAHKLPLARAVGERGKVHAFQPTAWANSKLTENLGLNPALQDRGRGSDHAQRKGCHGA